MEKTSFPSDIGASRITLKKHNMEIASKIFNLVDRDRQRLREFLPWVDATKTLQDEIDYLQMSREKWGTFELFDYGIYRNSDHQLMGCVGLHSIAWEHSRAEIGYWMARDYEGQGFMAEAVLALEKTSFASEFHRLEIRCSSRNQRSANVAKRCGYMLEGTLTQDTLYQGIYRDTLIFGKLGL